MKTLSILECRRVGKPLAKLWHTQGCYAIQNIQTRSHASPQRAVAFIGAGTAVTGPAARSEFQTVEGQAAAVTNWDPLAGDAYRALSDLATRFAQAGTNHTPERNAWLA